MEQQLLSACEKGIVEDVRQLLNNPTINLNCQDTSKSKRTPLYLACDFGHVEIVALLLKDERVDINKAIEYGQTPLYIACEKGYSKVVELLLSNNKVDVNEPKTNGKTPFYTACEKGFIETVRLLLNDKRVDVNKVENNMDATPFYAACENGNIDVVKLLLKDERVDVNKAESNVGATPFYVACERGHIEVARLLSKDERINLTEANTWNETPFNIACEKGHIEIMKLLLNDDRVDMNKEMNNGNGPTSFWTVCIHGCIEIVKLLLASEKKIDIKKKWNDTSALDISKERSTSTQKYNWETEEEYQKTKKNCSLIVQLLESFQMNPDETRSKLRKEVKYYEACLLECSRNGDINKFKDYFEEENVDVNWKSSYFEETSFFVGCQNGRLEIVEYMLASIRVLDIFSKDYRKILPSEIAKINSELQEKLDHEKEDKEIKQRQSNCLSIYNLLQEYQSNPKEVKIRLRKKLNLKELEKVEMDEILCREAIICRDVTKFKEDILNQKFDLEKKSYGKSIPELISQSLNFELLQELPKSIAIDLNLNDNKLSQDKVEQLYQAILKIEKLRSLRIQGCSISKENLLLIFQSIIFNLQVNDSLQIIEVDDMKLDNHEGLEIIPIEIKAKGTQEIARYIIDLAKSSQSIHRTKLMVVGYENVGKTTLLDCLFPLSDRILAPNFAGVNQEYFFSLEGKCLKQYYQGKLQKKFIFERKEWSVTKKVKKELFKEKMDYVIKIKKIQNSKEKIKLYFDDEAIRDLWFERLSRQVSNKATHGIEVNAHVWKPSTINRRQSRIFKTIRRGNRKSNEYEEKKGQASHIEFSTWDFAGQNDYYNTHHYFLSNRSIFLVLYRMDKGIKGLESLDFWLKSISSHLNQNYCDEKGKPFYSIIIVGTFLDSIDDQSSDENLRKTKVMEIYNNNGLKSPPFYFEVSCLTLENIEELREVIFNVSLSHSYMGENVPVGYLAIEKSIRELRKLKKDHPIIKTQSLIAYAQSQSQLSFDFDIEFTKRALRLLHEWGVCIYFDSPTELSNIVVLDPQYLTKKILGDLFKADEATRQMRINGSIDYSQLLSIWNGPTNLTDTYLSLLEKFEVCFIFKDQQNGNGNKIIIPNLLPDPEMIQEGRTKNLKLMKELDESEKLTSNQAEKKKIINEKRKVQEENQRMDDMENNMAEILNKLEKKWSATVPRGEIEIERIFSFNQVPSEMVSRVLVRFHDRIVDNIIWRRGVLLKHFNNKNENVFCLLEVKTEENLFEIRIRGKERGECLEMMNYIYEEVNIVSGNYGGIRWKECVRSPHFSKGLIDLSDIHQDCKLDLRDRKLICPITHFPIYGEDLLIKTGELDSLDQNDLENGYWNYSYESQNQESQKSQKSETDTIFENSQILNQKEHEKAKYLLNLLGFDLSRIDKVVGIENKNWKKSFEVRGNQIYGQHKDTPDLFKREDWIEQSESELRTSFIQYLGDYISKFRNVGWNHGNNSFVIPMIQGTIEDAAWRICDNGFGTVSKIDAGFYSQGVYTTSKPEYAEKYCQKIPKVFVIGFVIVGNPFPVIEHPFITDKEGKVVEEIEKNVYRPKKNENGYLGKPINPGYQSHFTLVDGRSISSAFPITKVEQLNEKWIGDELVVHESQIYPSYIVYSK